jgi:hypothetical protein
MTMAKRLLLMAGLAASVAACSGCESCSLWPKRAAPPPVQAYPFAVPPATMVAPAMPATTCAPSCGPAATLAPPALQGAPVYPPGPGQ